MALCAVDSAVVDVAAHTQLEHPLGKFRGEDVVLGWKPASDALSEDLKRALNRRLDDDLRAYPRFFGLASHGFPLIVKRSPSTPE